MGAEDFVMFLMLFPPKGLGVTSSKPPSFFQGQKMQTSFCDLGRFFMVLFPPWEFLFKDFFRAKRPGEDFLHPSPDIFD